MGINDSDGDGYSSCYVDCNDDADSDGANIYPGAATEAPLVYHDYDGDGFGDQFVNCLFIYMYDEYVDGWTVVAPMSSSMVLSKQEMASQLPLVKTKELVWRKHRYGIVS